MWGKFNDPKNEDMQPVRDWIDNKGGKIAYSPVGKIGKELERSVKMKNKFDEYGLVDEYGLIGKIKKFSKKEVEQAKKKLEGLASDDPDIIALAQVSNVKLLVSSDKKLHKDFTNTKIIKKGKIYQTKEDHEHLLRKVKCP